MKRWIALCLSVLMLMSILAGCKKAEEAPAPFEEIYSLTPDEKMTIAICALARSVNAQKAAAKPTCYTVKGVRTLDGIKTMETTSSYDNDKLYAVEDRLYFEEGVQTVSESEYIYVTQLNGKYAIVLANVVTENNISTKTYSVVAEFDSLAAAQTAWTDGKYGADMTYQTYGRLEDLILSVALSQGSAEAEVTSSTDYTLTISNEYKTERYTVVGDTITQFVWTEMTVEGEDENTWSYYWNVADVTLPNLAEFTLIVE